MAPTTGWMSRPIQSWPGHCGAGPAGRFMTQAVDGLRIHPALGGRSVPSSWSGLAAALSRCAAWTICPWSTCRLCSRGARGVRRVAGRRPGCPSGSRAPSSRNVWSRIVADNARRSFQCQAPGLGLAGCLRCREHPWPHQSRTARWHWSFLWRVGLFEQDLACCPCI